MVLALLNYSDGYPVTWVVKVGQKGNIFMNFQKLLAEKRKAARGKDAVSLNEKMKVNNDSFKGIHDVRI